MADRTGESMSTFDGNGNGNRNRKRADDDDDEQSAKIRQEIEQTRGNMSRTVNQIEERLSPAHIKEQVADIKQSVLGNYHEVKDHVKEDLTRELREAKGKVENEVSEAKDKVREATVGKVEHMVHDAKEMVHHAGERVTGMAHDAGERVTDAGSTVVDIIKANPIPAALVGIGLGWLLMSARSGSRSRLDRADRRRRRDFEYAGYGYRDTDDYYRFRDEGDDRFGGRRNKGGGGPRRILRQGERVAGDAIDRVEDTISNASHRVQEGASHLVDEASETAHAVGDKVSKVAHDAVEGAQHLADETKSRALHLADDVSVRGRRMAEATGRGVRRAEQSLENILRENPLAAGAVVIAVGAAIGLLLPHTRREDKWLGETKERLLGRAEDMATNAIEKVESKATKQLSGDRDRDRDRDRGRGRERSRSRQRNRQQLQERREQQEQGDQPKDLSNGIASSRSV